MAGDDSKEDFLPEIIYPSNSRFGIVANFAISIIWLNSILGLRRFLIRTLFNETLFPSWVIK